MTGKTFDEEFVQRLMALALEIERGAGVADDSDEEAESEETEMEPDTAAELASGFTRRRQIFAAIVQHLTDRYGPGPVEVLAPDRLRPLVEDAIDATETWAEEAEMETIEPQPKTPLQKLLKEHHDIGDWICAVRDEAEFGHDEENEQ